MPNLSVMGVLCVDFELMKIDWAAEHMHRWFDDSG
jgi:hypothetical protein